MAYTNYYPHRINWENFPRITTPLDEINLNKMDYALFMIDQLLGNWDNSKLNTAEFNIFKQNVEFNIDNLEEIKLNRTTFDPYAAATDAELNRLDAIKAEKSALLQDIKSVTYNSTTGVWKFTHQNGAVDTFDQNIEKIPVSFSMSPQGIITMTTADGTKFTADIASLIKSYTFNDTSVIDFTTTTDSSGNKTITATIKSGSITEAMLQPKFLSDCQTARTQAQNSAEDSEAWAIGTRGGSPVSSSDQTYHNNSKYYANQSESYATSADTSASQASMSADESEASALRAEQAVVEASDIIGANTVTIDFSTGNLVYSNNVYYTFTINTTTGDLEWEVNP